MFAALLEIKDTSDSVTESYMTLGFLWVSANLHWRCTSSMEHGSCHEVVSDNYYLTAIDYYSKLENHIFCNSKKKADLPTAFLKLLPGYKI